MLKITVISVGGMKESYFAEAIAEYEKRAGAYAEMKNINLKEAPLAATRAGDIAAALDAEGEQILKHLPLTVAYANKPVSLIWGMIWGTFIFGE